MGRWVCSLLALLPIANGGRITRTCHQRPRRPGMHHSRGLCPKGAPPRLLRRAQDPSAPRKSAPSTKSTSHWRSFSPNGVPLPKDSLHRGHSQRRIRERRTTAKSAPPKRSAVIHTKSRQRLDTVSHAHPHVSAFSWKKISSCLKLISIEDHLTATKLEELEEGWVLDASCVFNRYCTCLMLFLSLPRALLGSI